MAGATCAPNEGDGGPMTPDLPPPPAVASFPIITLILVAVAAPPASPAEGGGGPTGTPDARPLLLGPRDLLRDSSSLLAGEGSSGGDDLSGPRGESFCHRRRWWRGRGMHGGGWATAGRAHYC